jgi:hypothetical protein
VQPGEHLRFKRQASTTKRNKFLFFWATVVVVVISYGSPGRLADIGTSVWYFKCWNTKWVQISGKRSRLEIQSGAPSVQRWWLKQGRVGEHLTVPGDRRGPWIPSRAPVCWGWAGEEEDVGKTSWWVHCGRSLGESAVSLFLSIKGEVRGHFYF